MAPKKSHLGLLLKEARIKKAITQEQASRRLGLTSPQYISNIERGKCPASLETITVLIGLYDLKANKIIDIMTKEYRANIESKLSKRASRAR